MTAPTGAPKAPGIKTRKPTGIVPWPLLLIEGEEGAGKTYSAAQFSSSDRIGQMYWIDLDEGSADEYAAIEGADYLVIEHDGTYRDILEQIEAVHAEARRAAAAQEKPVVLVIDSASALWRMLTNWTYERGRRTTKNRKLLQDDPDAAFDIGRNLWNDALERWQRVVYLLRTLPGIAIVLARGKQVSATDDNGQPIRNQTEWKVAAQKDLGFDATCWIRMKRDADPQVIKVRSLRVQVQRGKPVTLQEFSIEDLVFGKLGCSVESQPRVMPALAGDLVQPWLSRIEELEDRDALQALWRSVPDPANRLSREEILTIRAAAERRAAELDSPRADMGDKPPSDADKLRAAARHKAAEQDADAEQ
ncbi:MULTISPECIES: AAA family ATPase [unclassified Streptomyces]|uniref:AAA family ATPase n=1 Tax=unclassified Streptomyces TaxID=2593676 RepID=UPI001E4084D2|nr:AAA family ATPase [Streptomyces sp. CB02980]MCB8906797.1 ATP-binding protein [Streptomyces sp. CB02980]